MISQDTDANKGLDAIRKDISCQCINCERCRAECDFIKKYGKPKHIADTCNPVDARCLQMAFECSLCSLCTAVCPVGLDPAKLFLEMRKVAVRQNPGHAGYHTLKAYEKRGTSRRYTWYAFPKGCDTVFFPGCTLTGTRPKQTEKAFLELKARVPSLGIVLDCCTKPSHDLGRYDYFNRMFSEMTGFLLAHGIRNVVVACPNCYKVFSEYGKAFSIQTLYEILDQNSFKPDKQIPGTVTVHDPCPMRFARSTHDAVRHLILSHGIRIVEMPHHGEKTLCCGEGGAVECINGELSQKWRVKRRSEAGENAMVTYCAGCAGILGKTGSAFHVLDLICDPAAAMKGKTRAAKPPFTYINRLLFKRKMKKLVHAAVTRERTL